MVQSFVADFDVESSEPVFLVGDRPAKQRFDIVLGKRLELKNLAARDQWSVDGEKWVFCGGADENHDSLFDVAEQNILLCAVEAMQLVDEQYGSLAGHLQPSTRLD